MSSLQKTKITQNDLVRVKAYYDFELPGCIPPPPEIVGTILSIYIVADWDADPNNGGYLYWVNGLEGGFRYNYPFREKDLELVFTI